MSDATDKPGGPAAGAGTAKPTRFVLQNPVGDITIVSDRDEKFVEFFRRQKVMIAGLPRRTSRPRLRAKKPSDRIFVNYASYNGESPMNATYGSYIQPRPLRADIFEMVDATAALVLVPDAKEQDVWHVVGITTRVSSAFFTSKEKKKGDDFAPADLLHTEKK